jgi:putative hydrolase of the HAD superfamily
MDIRLVEKGHIVFDIGNVLLSFCPDRAVNELAPDGKEKLYLKHVVGSHSWQELDRGTLTYDEAANIMCEHPEMAGEYDNVSHFLYNFPKLMRILPAANALHKLKSMDKKLYVLSNFHKPAFERVYEEYSFFKLFDGLCVSCYLHQIKPEPEIYISLLTDNSIPAEDAVFIDDVLENAKAAEQFGITGIHYQNDIDFS